MSAIRKPCAQAGCAALVERGRCAAHSASRFYDGRESAAKRGYDRRHQKWRRMILARDPWCKMCNRAPATEADHIIPISRGGERFALDNGQALCKPCHSRKTAGEQ